MKLVNRNLAVLLASQLATWAMTLAVILLVPKFLGAERFGSFSFANAYIGFFQLAAGLGTATLLTREIARDYSIVGSHVFNALALKVVVVAALSALALGLAVALQFSSQTLALVAVGCVGILIVALNEVLAGALNGMQRMGKSSAWTVGAVYAGSLGGILVLANDGSVVIYASVLTAANLIPLFGNALLLWPMVRGHLRIDLKIWRFLVRAGAPLMLLVVFNQIYGTIDVPILASIAGTTTVGWYVLAYRWAGIPIFITTAVIGSHYPEMSALGKEAGPAFAQFVNRALKIVLLAVVPAAVGLAVVAADLIDLFYGAEFKGSVAPLQILALQIPITSMDTILATALIACHRLRRYLIVAAGAAIANPILCIVAIRVTERAYDNGAIGAAIATAVTEVFVMGFALVVSVRGVMDKAMVWWTIRCVLAGSSIVLVVLVARNAHLAVQVSLGVVIYVIASLLVGTISTDMVRQVIEQVGKRLPGRSRDPQPGTTSE